MQCEKQPWLQQAQRAHEAQRAQLGHSGRSGHSPVLGAGGRQLPIAHSVNLHHAATGRPAEWHRVGEGRRQQVGLPRHLLLLGLLLLALVRLLRLLLGVSLLLCLLLLPMLCLLLCLMLCLMLHRQRSCVRRRHCLGLRLRQHVGRGGAASRHYPTYAEPTRLPHCARSRQRRRRRHTLLPLLLRKVLLLHLHGLLCLLRLMLSLLGPLPLLPGRCRGDRAPRLLR